MDPIILAIYFLVLGLVYLLAGHMAYGPETTATKISPDMPFVSDLGNSESTKILILQIILVAFIFSGLLITVIFFLSNFGSILNTIFHAFVFIVIFHFMKYLFERIEWLRNITRLPNITSLLLSIIVFSLYEYYYNVATNNIVSLLMTTIFLVGFRNWKLKAFLVFGSGILIYDAIAVFLSRHMQTAAGYIQDMPGGMLVVPISMDPNQPVAITIGLGDIAIPAVLLMIAYRQGKHFETFWLWLATFAGYVVASIITYLIAIYTEHAQPATIYLIPGVLLGYFIAVWRKGLTWEEISTI